MNGGARKFALGWQNEDGGWMYESRVSKPFRGHFGAAKTDDEGFTEALTAALAEASLHLDNEKSFSRPAPRHIVVGVFFSRFRFS